MLKLKLSGNVVDLHNHVHLKAYMYDRDINKRKFISNIWGSALGFWPFSHRNTLYGIKKSLDVALCTTFIVEKDWYKEVPLINWTTKLSPSFRKRIMKPSYFDATIAMMDFLEQQIETDIELRLTCNPRQLKKNIRHGLCSIIHSVEGAHSLQSEGLTHDDCLRTLADRGVAYLTLAHFFPNDCVAGNVWPWPEKEKKFIKDYYKKKGNWDERRGLTDLGKEIVHKMLELGIIIDISHLTLVGRKQVYKIVEEYDKDHAVIASHVGAFGVHRISYNLQDWELKWLADRGCCAGVILMNSWVSPHNPEGSGLQYIEQTIDHMINVAGYNVVALGTDFDGFTDPPDEITKIEDLEYLPNHLVHVGYESAVVDKFMGDNAMRVLLNGWRGCEENKQGS